MIDIFLTCKQHSRCTQYHCYCSWSPGPHSTWATWWQCWAPTWPVWPACLPSSPPWPHCMLHCQLCYTGTATPRYGESCVWCSVWSVMTWPHHCLSGEHCGACPWESQHVRDIGAEYWDTVLLVSSTVPSREGPVWVTPGIRGQTVLRVRHCYSLSCHHQQSHLLDHHSHRDHHLSRNLSVLYLVSEKRQRVNCPY